MPSININFGNFIAGDAAGPMQAQIGKNNVSYEIPGVSYTSMNVLFLVLTIAALLNQKNISSLFLSLGLDEEGVQFYAGLVLVLTFLSGQLAAALIAFARRRHVTITNSQVTVDFPNNPLRKARSIALSSYSGVTRRWGRRYIRSRKIEQEIIELVHTDPLHTIPIQINEDHSSSEQKIAAMAKSIGVDHLASSYGKLEARENAAKEKQLTPREPNPFVVNNRFSTHDPPGNVKIENIIDGSKARTKISRKELSLPFWGKALTPILPTALLWYGVLAPDRILVFFGAILLAFSAWRLIFGKDEYVAVFVDQDVLTLAKDRRHLRHMLLPRDEDLKEFRVNEKMSYLFW